MRRALAIAACVAAAGAASGTPLDDSRPLKCVPTELSQCDLAALCDRVSFDEADIPHVIRVDFAEKRIATLDGARTSPIRSVEVAEAVLVVQGSQNGRGWSLVVERATGHMSASVAESEGAFVLVGSCSAE